jgi:hypothetical protein
MRIASKLWLKIGVIVAASAFVTWLPRRRKSAKPGASMDFEFGQTEQSEAFFDRHPKFYPAFERLSALANKCFGRAIDPTNRTEDICFDIGRACRADYMEILFLASNGYGTAASKLLRGLYERAVALAYIVKHPEKAERFVRFAAIQEYKALVAALKIVTEEQFNSAIRVTTAAEIRERREQVKPEFQVRLCDECGHMGTAFSWDTRDVAAMVHDIGDPYDKYYLGSYTIPNLHVHATLASVFHEPDPTAKLKKNQEEADFALLCATAMLILAIRSQNVLFALNLDAEIETCERDVTDVFQTR